MAVACGYAVNVNIPGSTRTIYVDSEDLLEEAVELELRSLGVNDVDFDRVFNQPGVYDVEIESFSLTTEEAMDLLKTALKNLGFFDATVKGGFLRSLPDYFGRIEDHFSVHLNTETKGKVMSSFALRTLQNSDISVEQQFYPRY